MLTKKNETDVSEKIEGAIRAFEAYLYDQDNNQESDKLAIVKTFLAQARDAWFDLSCHDILGYFSELENLIDCLAQGQLVNEHDAHDVLIGALNQLLNYHDKRDEYKATDADPLRAVRDDIRSVVDNTFRCPQRLIELTADLDVLTDQSIVEANKASYDWPVVAQWQGGNFFADNAGSSGKAIVKAKLAFLNQQGTAQALVAAVKASLSPVDDYLLSMIALMQEVAQRHSVSPSLKRCLENAFEVAVRIIDKRENLHSTESIPNAGTNRDEAALFAQRLREMLLVLIHQQCDTVAATTLIEKYQLRSVYEHSQPSLQINTPDQQTKNAFLANIESSVDSVQAALEDLAEVGLNNENCAALKSLLDNLRQATQLAGYSTLSTLFEQMALLLDQSSLQQTDEKAILENLVSGLVEVRQVLELGEHKDDSASPQLSLISELAKATRECRLALETETLSATSLLASEPQSLMDEALNKYFDALNAITFLNEPALESLLNDVRDFAVRNLLTQANNRTEQESLDIQKRFQRVLQLSESYWSARNASKQSDATQLFDQISNYLQALNERYPDKINSTTVVAFDAPVSNGQERTEPVGENLYTQEDQQENSQSAASREISEPLDEEIVEIFLEEADEVYEELVQHTARLEGFLVDQDANSIGDAVIELRRAYHTLKGSGRMAGAEHIGDAAWEVEQLLNRVLDNSLPLEQNRVRFLQSSCQYFQILIADFNQKIYPVQEEYDVFLTTAKAANSDQPFTFEGGAEAEHSTEVKASDLQPELVVTHVVGVSDRDNKKVFDASETANALQTLIESERRTSDRMLGGLAGSNLSSDISADDTNVDQVQFVDDVSVRDHDSDDSQIGDTEDNKRETAFIDADDALSEQSFAEVEFADSNDDAIASNDRQDEDGDDVLRAIFIEEAEAQQAILREYLSANTDQPSSPSYDVERALHTLAGGAKVTKSTAIAEIASPCEQLVGLMRSLNIASDEQLTALNKAADYLDELLSNAERSDYDATTKRQASVVESLVAAIQQCSDTSSAVDSDNVMPGSVETEEPQCSISVQHQVDPVSIYQANQFLKQWRYSICAPEGVTALVEELEDLVEKMASVEPIVSLAQALKVFYKNNMHCGLRYQAYVVAIEAHADLELMLDNHAIGMQVSTSRCLGELQTINQEDAKIRAESEQLASEDVATTPQQNGADQEIIAIFMEESSELIEELELNIQRWLSGEAGATETADILRGLHTIKGGARMAYLNQVGDLCHDFESYLQAMDINSVKISKKIQADVNRHLSSLVAALARIEQGNGNQAKASADDSSKDNLSDDRPHEEYVRVSATALDQLASLAGETSISRSLIEARLNDFGYAIDEIDSTVGRLNEQLRRLEIETEAQINFRKEQVEIERLEEFDPLEMDRYSQIQQISRSLSESASDIQALRATLLDKTRDIETLLLQQSRTNTELQEGLMRTRTVPLSRTIIPRLRRTIRQVSGELDKPVKLQIANNEGELDRNVIERMVAPLEHVLRNAIDHGIESIVERAAKGKPELGTITLDLHREGGEVVISLSDDGKGIDLESVRAKAIALGLMKEDDSLTDEQIMHFIFSRGFSTASSVTQISGRGIGMDVVQNEIRELGGSITLYSKPNKGTTFVFRLPFAVSMGRALLVMAGGETLAVPIDAVEGVVRVSPYELDEYYGDQAIDFMYAGQKYDFSYLGSYINGSKPSYQSDMIGALPVLLVNTGERLVALQVDGLLGSREIVVKNLGPQFSRLKTVSGATILGDGSVVMIVDLSMLVRKGVTAVSDVSKESRSRSRDRKTIMVVDDSVTVRKVTSRLLQRNGYDVVTAKDGQDALAKLEDQIPDVMLLDIEMPNIDGFEVVARVRHDERLQHLPIIMISSRTGAKHTERALSLGADEFLGKPYQDTYLLERVATYFFDQDELANVAVN